MNFLQAASILVVLAARLKQAASTNNQHGEKRKAMQAADALIVETGGEIKLSESDIARFWAKVDKNGPLPDQSNPHYAGLERCWVWTAAIDNGYGVLWVAGRNYTAHRISFLIQFGRMPVGFGCHKCDRRECCSPFHIFEGSSSDNMMDASRKGRLIVGDAHYSRTNPEKLARGLRSGRHTHPEKVARGEDQWLSKLTADQIPKIFAMRAEGAVLREIGEAFGISIQTAHGILARKAWKHVIIHE